MLGNIPTLYRQLPQRIAATRERLQRPLTLSEKILYSHLASSLPATEYERSRAYAEFHPDRVAMQDATAQMALLQFMQAGKKKSAAPATIHCDHLIQGQQGARQDLAVAVEENQEIYHFLAAVASTYQIDFWPPGSGIIHQVLLENYAFPGGLMIGADSHTPNAGGMGMLAIGVGGADIVDAMAGMPWELCFPRLIGIELRGQLSHWASAKDIILKLAGILSVKGGTGAIVEYFGPGAEKLSCTGKATICNMGAEIGATTSVFGYDRQTGDYLRATKRNAIADAADDIADCLRADAEVAADPERFFDRVIRLDLDTLEPYINGPFSPDKAHPISQFAAAVQEAGWPTKMEVGLIGSCTNSSYEDMQRAASIARQANDLGFRPQAEMTVTPGSEIIYKTMQKEDLLEPFERLGATILSNSCGPCIGQWKRHQQATGANSIMTSFNRNFAGRNDGNALTHAFVASPEIVTAFVLAGDLRFNPLCDALPGSNHHLQPPPAVAALPDAGFAISQKPQAHGSTKIHIAEDSKRLQQLQPFAPWEGNDLTGLHLLLKVAGKCTTDHISMAGPWLRFRGHLDNISNNLLIGATNAFNGAQNKVKNPFTKGYEAVPDVARACLAAHVGTVIIGDENYGEGSSREHAAMEPRHLGVRAVIARSFARIHETNLKKQGILALTFATSSDYDRIFEDDRIDLLGLTNLAPNKTLRMQLKHSDGKEEEVLLKHSYNSLQILWFQHGSALNLIRMKQAKIA